jgi:hypothetical protein
MMVTTTPRAGASIDDPLRLIDDPLRQYCAQTFSLNNQLNTNGSVPATREDD